jgi:hypothetical protein
LRPRKIVLHPFAGSPVAEPLEAGDGLVGGTGGLDLVVERIGLRPPGGGTGFAGCGDGGDCGPNLIRDALPVAVAAGRVEGGAPAGFGGRPVAHQHVAEGASAGDVIGVVAIMNPLHTGEAVGRGADLEGRVSERLAGERHRA